MAQVVSVIVTVLNEEKTIIQLLESLNSQTYPINELLIADGGSKDQTLELLKKYQEKHPQFPLEILHAPGNRSVGRNKAISAATSKIIAITDAGCEPHRDWVAELIACYDFYKTKENSELVVAGYYDARPKTPFEEAVVPYVLVMPDKVNPETFLPATRSVLLEKKVWESVHKFDEKLRWNEDYDFAQKLQKAKVKIVFTEKAKVTWFPRENLLQFWKMIFHFAQGDVQAGIWRNKVLFIFARYILALILLSAFILAGFTQLALGFIVLGNGVYGLWAVMKNQRYVEKGTLWLPVLQVSSDLAVIFGSLAGIISL